MRNALLIISVLSISFIVVFNMGYFKRSALSRINFDDEIDAWVVMVTVSHDFQELFDNWWYHFSQLRLSMEVILVAEDNSTFTKYRDKHSDKYNVVRDEHVLNIPEVVVYGSDKYYKMVSKRLTYILKEIQKGHNVIFSDADTIWLRNPLMYLKSNYDIWSTMDTPFKNCTGFIAIKASKAVEMFLIELKNIKSSLVNQQQIDHLLKTSEVKNIRLPITEFPSSDHTCNKNTTKDVVVYSDCVMSPDRNRERFINMGLWTKNSPSQCPKQLPPGIQMGPQQISTIQKVLMSSSNLLVWGLGNDSPYWNNCTKGRVVFLEDGISYGKHGVSWYDTIMKKFPYLEAYKIHYTTSKSKSFDKYYDHPELWKDLDLRQQLPTSLTTMEWHVIIIDAPIGYDARGPGRYQSIVTSSLLAHPGSHIFVDDYERKIERLFSIRIFGKPVEVITRQMLPNEQAHFIVQNGKGNTQSMLLLESLHKL